MTNQLGQNLYDLNSIFTNNNEQRFYITTNNQEQCWCKNLTESSSKFTLFEEQFSLWTSSISGLIGVLSSIFLILYINFFHIFKRLFIKISSKLFPNNNYFNNLAQKNHKIFQFLFLKNVGARVLTLVQFGCLLQSFAFFSSIWTSKVGEVHVLCSIQAILLQSSMWLTFLWSMMLAFFLLLKIVLNLSREKMFISEIICHNIVWGITLICTLLPFYQYTYGRAGSWCWIEDSDIGQIWRMLTWYVPAWIMILLCLLMYIIVLINVSVFEQIKKRNNKKKNEEVSPLIIKRRNERKSYFNLLGYPCVFMLCWFFPTINRIDQLIKLYIYRDKSSNFILTTLHGISQPLQGLGNVFVYFASPYIAKGFAFVFCFSCSVYSKLKKRKNLKKNGKKNDKEQKILDFLDINDDDDEINLPPMVKSVSQSSIPLNENIINEGLEF